MIWLTIDVEEVTDMNFNVLWHKEPKVDYEKYIDKFLEIKKDHKATAFVLGSFALKYPKIVKKLSANDIEIASHGLKHKLVYKESFNEWSYEVSEAKKILEDIVSMPIKGYRSPSWSMPFEKRYYTKLRELGYTYSSSYFPMKNYMYGNSIDKKEPFFIYTVFGKIEERPIPKYIFPYSGGFYTRVLPLFLLKYFFTKNKNSTVYIHPYELIDGNLLNYFKQYADKNIDYFLAFFTLGSTIKKLKKIINDK